MKHHPVEDSAFRMPLVIYPGHSKGNDSKNRPNFREKQNILIFVELDKFAIEINKFCGFMSYLVFWCSLVVLIWQSLRHKKGLQA